MSAPYKGQSSTKGIPGIIGDNTNGGDGVWGQANATPTPGRGLVGVSDSGAGVWGDTKTGRAVVGVVREKGDAVWGETSLAAAWLASLKMTARESWESAKLPAPASMGLVRVAIPPV